MSPLFAIFRILYIGQDLLSEALRFLRLMVSAKASLAAEVLFLRKQLAFYRERKTKPRRFNDSARLSRALTPRPDTPTGRISCFRRSFAQQRRDLGFGSMSPGIHSAAAFHPSL